MMAGGSGSDAGALSHGHPSGTVERTDDPGHGQRASHAVHGDTVTGSLAPGQTQGTRAAIE